MATRIPQRPNKWTGIYRGKFLGDLNQTFNIDLKSNDGSLSLSKRTRIITDSGDISGSFGLPSNFIKSNASGTSKWWASVGTKLLNSSSAVSAFTADGTASSPTTVHDIVVHEKATAGDLGDRLVATTGTELYMLNRVGTNAWDATWWTGTLGQTALTDCKMLVKLERLLLVPDGQFLHTVDKDDVVNYKRLTFPSGFAVQVIVITENRAYIGLRNDRGGNGKVVVWDGSAESYEEVGEEIPGRYPYSGFAENGVPHFINELGQILRYSGGGFVEHAVFPFNEEGISMEGTEYIAKHGCTVANNGEVLINVAYGQNGSALLSKRMRGGVWALDTKEGRLYHKNSLGQSQAAGTDVDYGQAGARDAGAIVITNETGEYLVGGIVFDAYNSTHLAVICRTINDDSRGYFVTQLIPSSEIQSWWQTMWLKFKKFADSGNRIITKYRVVEQDVDSSNDSLNVTITWASTTTFTGVVPTGVAVGDEVEVLAGDNAGCLFHISELSATPDGVATITVTIDEAAPFSSTSAALARFDSWTKMEVISDTSIRHKQLVIGSADVATGEYIQFKVELRGLFMEFYEAIAVEKESVNIEI